MDEIIIDEKRYVSSKQAAKLTGYAKDYIGQLCREGRVPARLVGRSWYVLESAIQDHRFGSQEEPMAAETPAAPQEAQTKPESMPTWEFPRYEAAHVEPLPSINRLSQMQSGAEETNDRPSEIHDSWKNWFDQVSEDARDEKPLRVPSEEVDSTASEPFEDKDTEQESVEVSVPIHAMRADLPRRELMPSEARSTVRQTAQKKARAPMRFTGTLQVAGALIALASLSLAAIGSGILDSYVSSNSQASMISGVIMYNK